MEIFQHGCSICRNKALVSLWTKLGLGRQVLLLALMLFNCLLNGEKPLQMPFHHVFLSELSYSWLLNLWPTLIKYEIKIQISEMKVQKFLWRLERGKRREMYKYRAVSLLRRNQNMTITVPLQQPVGQSITARSVSWVNTKQRGESRDVVVRGIGAGFWWQRIWIHGKLGFISSAAHKTNCFLVTLGKPGFSLFYIYKSRVMLLFKVLWLYKN